MALVFVLGRTLRLDGLTQARDLRGQAAGSLRNAFEFQSNLAALSAEGFRLRRCGCNLSPQTLLLAADACQSLLRLRELIAEVGSSADCLQNGRPMRLLLLLQHRQVGGGAGRFLLAERELLLGRRKIRCCRMEQLLVAIKFLLKRREPQ